MICLYAGLRFVTCFHDFMFACLTVFLFECLDNLIV